MNVDLPRKAALTRAAALVFSLVSNVGVLLLGKSLNESVFQQVKMCINLCVYIVGPINVELRALLQVGHPNLLLAAPAE